MIESSFPNKRGIFHKIIKASALSGRDAISFIATKKWKTKSIQRDTLPSRNSFSPSSLPPLYFSPAMHPIHVWSKLHYHLLSLMRYTRVCNARYAHVIYAKLSNPEMTSYTLGPRTTSSREQENRMLARGKPARWLKVYIYVYIALAFRECSPVNEKHVFLTPSDLFGLNNSPNKCLAVKAVVCCQYLMWSESKINFTARVLAVSTKVGKVVSLCPHSAWYPIYLTSAEFSLSPLYKKMLSLLLYN